MVKDKNFVACVVAAVMLFAAIYIAFFGVFTAHAETSDGVYSVDVSNNIGSMGDADVPHTATLEKSGDFYYLSLTFEGNQLSDIKLKQVDGKTVGTETKIENGNTTFTYTLSAETVGSLNFSCHVKAMNDDVDFTLTPNISGATKTGEYTSTAERPAYYVPDIVTTAGSSYTAETGSIFTIPAVSATLGSEICGVTTSVTYNGEEIAKINENQFSLSNAGEYILTYKATSSSYKTNLDSDSYSTYEVKITSKIGATTLAKIEDTNGILGENISMQASEVTEGSLYETAKTAMKTVSDNFRVVGVELFDADGNSVTPAGSITLKIQPSDTFDRTQTNVYYMDENGSLSEISCSPYGRYVSFQTEKVGTFILSYGGVAFHMPMWGYLLICICAVLIIAAVVIVAVVLVKRKKKQAKTC